MDINQTQDNKYNKMRNTPSHKGWMDGWINEGGGLDLTIKPGNGDTLKENQEQQAHATGRVIIEQFEDINATLKETKG